LRKNISCPEGSSITISSPIYACALYWIEYITAKIVRKSWLKTWVEIIRGARGK
jgi:hypothetical protein